MTDLELVDRVARRMREEYARHEPRVFYHIQNHPWETLTDHRRAKWRVMAAAAIEEIQEEPHA